MSLPNRPERKKDFTDYLMQPISIGDYAIGYGSNNGVPEVYKVIEFKPKTILLEEINTGDTKRKKPKEIIILEKEQYNERFLNQPIYDASTEILYGPAPTKNRSESD